MGKRTNQGKTVSESAESTVYGMEAPDQDFQGMLWRVERLERQLSKLSELIREHAVDADRLVQIVAEDREILHQELALRLSAAGKSKKTSQPPSEANEFISS